MELIPLSNLIIPPNRWRREFDPESLSDLQENIQKFGLLHPVVVRNDGRTLVAGERRVRVIQNLAFIDVAFKCNGRDVSPGMIPVTRLSEMSDVDAREAELSENTIRADFSWQERADAISSLAELRKDQRGMPATVRELTEEIAGRQDGRMATVVQRSLAVAKHLDKPEIKKAKTLDEAFKILKTQEIQQKYAEIGAKLPSEILKNQHRLTIGDFRNISPSTLPKEGFAVTITDPPYGIEADGIEVNSRAASGHTYSDPKGEEWKKLMSDLCDCVHAYGAADSHHYLFSDFHQFPFLRDLWEKKGFRVWSTPFIMYRTTSVRAPWQECGPWKSYECILYAMKGRRACNVWRTDVISCRGDENLGHGAQKPLSVYVDLLERSVKPGESVADFCCGTGTIFPAAQAVKAIAFGVELSPQNAAIAAKRLEELK